MREERAKEKEKMKIYMYKCYMAIYSVKELYVIFELKVTYKRY